MLYAFGFERVGVVVGDLYFVDPRPIKGQEGAEHGVRLELRVLVRGELKGTIYSATPIEVGRPIWRVDLLESVDGKPGSFDRTHHHPVFKQWNPSKRVFVRELSADPLGWLSGKLADLADILAGAGFEPDTAGPDDAADLRAGQLGTPPRDTAGNADNARNTDTTRNARNADTVGNADIADNADDEDSAAYGAEQVLVRAGWL
jgi:hypothetical protein